MTQKDGSTSGFMQTEYGDMCPNCVTPWKCNGPHLQPPEETQKADSTQGWLQADYEAGYLAAEIERLGVLCDRYRAALEEIAGLPHGASTSTVAGIASRALDRTEAPDVQATAEAVSRFYGGAVTPERVADAIRELEETHNTHSTSSENE